MRKTLLFTAITALSLTASAQEFVSWNNSELGAPGLVSETTATAPAAMRSRIVPNEADDIAGSYVFRTVSSKNNNVSGEVTIAQDGDKYSVTGLIRGGKALEATYADGVLTIPAGQVSATSATYGDATLYVMVSATTYNKTIAAQLTRGEDGTLTLTNGTGFIQMLSGDYEGYTYGDKYNGYEASPVNGTIESNLVTSAFAAADPATSTFNSHVKVADGQGVLTGVDGLGWVNFTYDEEGNVTFEQDSVYYHSTTYYNATFTKGVKNSSGNFALVRASGPEGLIDVEQGMLLIDYWCLAMVNKSTNGLAVVNGRKSGSTVTFPPVVPTTITDVKATSTPRVRKYVEAGQIVIERDGVRYNVVGQKL